MALVFRLPLLERHPAHSRSPTEICYCRSTSRFSQDGGDLLLAPKSVTATDLGWSLVPALQTARDCRTQHWLENYRRLVLRWDPSVTIYSGFVPITCFMIVSRRILQRAFVVGYGDRHSV